MAPGAKRKRGDARSYSQDDDNTIRQSPHRPQNLSLAHSQQANNPRGGRRGSRNSGRGGHSGYGGHGGPHSPSVTTHQSPTAMSPPANAYQASKPPQRTPTTPAPPKEQPTIKADIEAFGSYEHLSPERAASWSADTRKAVVQTAITARQNGETFEMNDVLSELITACLGQLMDVTELGTMVRDIVTSPAPADESLEPATLFLDTLTCFVDDDSTYPQLKQMLIATEIDVAKMRSVLEQNLLVKLELVRPSFPKVAVRKATNALYRQTNYNLLREETEGFSKLMTEYFTTVNNEPPSREVISNTYQRVNAFIGAFDLDVGRVLDVTLDVFANLLVKHYKFFIKYLRVSAWWPELQSLDGVEWQEPDVKTLPNWALPESPLWYYSDAQKDHQLQLREERDLKFWARVRELVKENDKSGIKAFFELGTRPIIQDLRQSNKSGSEDSSNSTKKSQQWANEWIAETGTLPPPGNDIAAQLLGFKLRFYASDARDAHDVLPDNLIYLAALLIKIGFISIVDLYPHLYPADEDMPAHRIKLEQEKKEREDKRKGNGSNALAMAGALPDDTLPMPAVSRLRDAENKPASKSESERSSPAKSDEDTKDKLPDPADQKVALLRSLLCIGAISEALFIIGRFPWLLDVYPDLHPHIFRLAHHSLSKVYEAARPVPLEKITSIAKGANNSMFPRLGDFTARRTLRWAKPDQKDAGDGIDYRFYWEDWSDNVPVCQNVDDVFLLCSSLLGLIGPECGRDIVLMTKLARIGRKSVTDDPSRENLERWSDLAATFLAPALTFTGQNPGVVNEMWELFKRFETATRYTIYQHWFNLTKPPAIRSAFQDVRDGTRNLLGKVASTNTRPTGRAMAKLAYACPGIVFQQTLKQGQSYPNMIDALVECSRYLTHLGYDCLTWALVNTLVTNDKPTLQGDGMLVKGWLKNTAIFIGKAYRKYGLMDPTPVLQFVKHQIFRPEGELFMLTVLEQLITEMGGIGMSGALTEARVLALSAGPRLRSYTLEHHLGDKRHKNKSSARRLLRCLKEVGLTPQILIALARQVETYLFRKELEEVPDKVVFTNFDNLRSSYAQFLEFLRENLTNEDFDDQIPGVVELMSDFGLEAGLAFQICRDSISTRVNATRLKDRPANAGITADGDVAMGGVEGSPNNKIFSSSSDGIANKVETKGGDVDMEDAAVTGNTEAKQPSTELHPLTNGTSTASNEEIEAIAQQLKSNLPDVYGEHSHLKFFVTFWQLSLKDVYLPTGEELRKQYEDAKSYLGKAGPGTSSIRQAREEMNKLGEEYQAFLSTAQLTRARLREEMQQWFEGIPMMGVQAGTLHDALLQDCFLPRLRMSLQDAQFASRMLFFLHSTGTPGFRMLKLLDQLFTVNKLSAIIMTMSEDESKYFGRFLNDILRELWHWHEDKTTYDKLALGENERLPGFGMKFDSDRTPTEILAYEQFRTLHCKWHHSLFNALKKCLSGGNYTELRNGINILKAVSPVFPKVDTMAKELRQIIEQHAKDDDRDDVKVAANSILYEFKRSASLWKSEQTFRTGKLPDPSPATLSRTASEQSKTPQPADAAVKKLNAAAPTFNPTSPETNGLSKPPPKPAPEKSASEDRKPPPATSTTNTAAAPRLSTGNSNKPPPGPSVPAASKPPLGRDNPRSSRPSLPPTPSTPSVPSAPSAQSSSVPNRPESRSGPQHPPNRAAHNLPTRPDAQPSRVRQPERPVDRPMEYSGSHPRHDNRPSGPAEYGRPERASDTLREREAPSGRRRSRSPNRNMNSTDRREWVPREAREYDERALRPPPRDTRGPPNRGAAYGEAMRDPRDVRDQRDYRERDPLRERGDPRGPPQAPLTPTDGRSRLHSSPMLSTNEAPSHRREQLNAHHGDRSTLLPPRPTPGGGPSVNDRPLINPERAAFINGDRARNESSRPDREPRREDRRDDREPRRDERARRDRGSRPESPRRSDDRNAAHDFATHRERREEMTNSAPTGPRGGRDAPTSGRVSREMFTPSQPSRPVTHQTQDPNYGRLNPPTDSIPSGPRHTSDRRDSQARLPAQTPPTAPASAQPTGVHPSRLNNFRAPQAPGEIPGAPSGPRGSRGSVRNTINTVLTQPPPAPAPEKRQTRERSRSAERSREKRDPGRRDRERSDRDRDRDRERREDRRGREERGERGERSDRGERKRPREPTDQAHGDTKRRR